jgi:hypothetical protein
VVLLAVGLLAAACNNPKPGPGRPVGGAQISGIVEESQDSPPYTYLRIRTDEGSTWAAVPLGSVKPGARIHIVSGVALRNFDAPGLSRRFESIVFGVVR